MRNPLRLLFSSQARKAARQARPLVEEQGGCRVVGVALRVAEPSRYVFAVFYEGPLPQRPTPYKLIAVHKASGNAEELSLADANQYRLRGYR